MSKTAEFSINRALASALKKDRRWKLAHDTAKQLFDDLVLVANAEKNIWDFPDTMLSFSNRFATSEGFTAASDLVGKISLREVFDELAVVLEIKLIEEESGETKRGLDVVFNDLGEVLHAAVG